jgi:hypothetical protein
LSSWKDVSIQATQHDFTVGADPHHLSRCSPELDPGEPTETGDALGSAQERRQCLFKGIAPSPGMPASSSHTYPSTTITFTAGSFRRTASRHGNLRLKKPPDSYGLMADTGTTH